MKDFIIGLDESLFLILNSWHHSFVDDLMWWISDFRTWIPLFIYWIYLLYKKNKKSFFSALLMIIMVITLSDQISSRFFKPYFQRLRPSHEQKLSKSIHLLEEKKGQIYKGGKYGFVSSHAANVFAVVLFLYLYIGKLFSIYWFFWAFLVSYSRIYLGVHYPLDIIVGAILGIIVSYIVFLLFYSYIFKKSNINFEKEAN
ncbi:MAG: phosphatase PAP2 family protein [Cytophagales bacterium]|nr:MAG: phosphatase PAP2 family protein [Cytophagales bacterium]